mmetsp:Transcript_4361/g.16039  ORF Transcript_4361/g.16039 Transcript_4361/m.16039 type:complete len:208 (-) Transcript_4361:102-725(-)
MVKHNNIVPNLHFHKQWQKRISINFNQAAKKKARRVARAAKAAAVAPRPASGLLRPKVRGQTVRYNTKVRAGRGFTLDELAAAGVAARVARTIGIAVDHRRRSSNLATFEDNVQRLKAYKARLLVFPKRRSTKAKSGDSTKEELKGAQQDTAGFPVVPTAKVLEIGDLSAARAETGAYRRLRAERQTQRMWGKRIKRAADEEAAKKK